MSDHEFQWKPGAEYAIETYGSELAGDVMNCAICGVDLLHHDKPNPFRTDYDSTF
jgi:hypothetical protein